MVLSCPHSSISWLVAIRSGAICLALLIHTRKHAFEVVWKAPKETCFKLLVLLPRRKDSAFHQLFILLNVFLQHLWLMALLIPRHSYCNCSRGEQNGPAYSTILGLWMLGCLTEGKLEIHSSSLDRRLDILYSFPRHKNWQGLKKSHGQEVHLLYCHLLSHKTKSFLLKSCLFSHGSRGHFYQAFP